MRRLRLLRAAIWLENMVINLQDNCMSDARLSVRSCMSPHADKWVSFRLVIKTGEDRPSLERWWSGHVQVPIAASLRQSLANCLYTR